MTTTGIPTSGDFMRLFGRTSMTGAALRIANTLAGHISYDGIYREAPRGYAAFTMKELQGLCTLSERAVRTGLDELAGLFGLTVVRRHHNRHWFIFRDLTDTDKSQTEASTTRPKRQAGAAIRRLTGKRVPPSLYIRTKINNNIPSEIEISNVAGSVYHTPFAALINEAKQGTQAEGIDAQFLWTGFQMLNVRNKHLVAPLEWLIAFIRKAKPLFVSRPSPPDAPKGVPAPVKVDPVAEMAKPAVFANRTWNESDLRKVIGDKAYENRITAIENLHDTNRFAARQAVHGQAVRAGTIPR